MNRLLFLPPTIFLIAPIFLQTGAQSSLSGEPASKKAEEEVRAAERKWLDALYRLDAATLDATESDDFTFIAPPAVSTKLEHLTVVRQRLQASVESKSVVPPTKYSVTRHAIRLYGTTALVTNILSVEDSGQDPPITSPGTFWQTELWHRERGVWRLVHLHMTPMAHHRM